MKKKEIERLFTRVALYIRVSGEEQKIKGLSLEAQQERLEAYAREQGWSIVGIYIDAAKTARKRLHKRAAFQDMLAAVKRDEIDMLLFTRLDRWFRSVPDYYKVMDVLDAHHCEWKTIDDGEGYDTTTASGRLYINIKLSIAQNEADICGERIDVVFDSKVSHGTVISGSAPFGYRVNSEKRLEISPDDAAIVRDAFDYYENNVTKRGTVTHIRDTYGVNWCDATFRRMLSDEIYTGVYNRGDRYNENFCPPIISREQFDRVQDLATRNSRNTPTGRVYIFTSILTCSECGHKLVGYTVNDYYYYRCNHHFLRKLCTHNHSANERKIETWLLTHLEEELSRCKLDWSVRAAARKASVNRTDKTSLKRKLSKLKELYLADLIDIEEYKKDYELYATALNNIEEPAEEKAPDFSAVEKLLGNDFHNLYNGLSREDKRTLWRSVIKEIRIDNDHNITSIIFV